MTVKELRGVLFFVENQKLTVKELRDILFQVEEQDVELKPYDIIKLTRKDNLS